MAFLFGIQMVKCTCAFPCGQTNKDCPSVYMSPSPRKEQLLYVLEDMDAEISIVESRLSQLQEQRREFVNRHDLNKA